jgi:prepilin-type N-terminal cleavage/methylation domain-containing protein
MRMMLSGMVGRSTKGFAFIEILISLALLGIVSTAFFGAMGTASKSLIVNDEQQTSKNLAEMQLEYLKSLPYASSYVPAAIPAGDEGYSVLTNGDGRLYAEAVASRDNNIQKLTVTIVRDGKDAITVSGFKVQ